MGSKTKIGSPKLGKPYLMLLLASSPLYFKARDKKVHWTFLFCDWVNRNLFNEHYTIFLEIGLKALLIQGFHDKIVIKKCNVYKMWVSFWVSFALKNVIVYLLL